jgi:hypothetical protein
MTIEQAIEKAVEGGWPLFEGEEVDIHTGGTWPMIYGKANGVDKLWPLNDALQMPSFWRSLGKSLFWDNGGEDEDGAITIVQWRYEWHRFIDHLADGGPAETYFASL